ncbi:MAG: molybdate ABC transporter substrate-binding protein [Verrucomicrobiia bacterium]|jgi:molybdate transport system substrate-binding protein
MKYILSLLVAVAVGLGLLGRFHMQSRLPQGRGTLMVYCAASLKKPVEAIAADFQKEHGWAVSLQYGGSASLLSAARVSKTGDLFLSADDGTIADARKNGLIGEVTPLVKQRPVIIVTKGNPKNIRALDDLLKPGLRLALANPESASISRVVRKALGERWQAFASHAMVFKPTVMDVAADAALGSVDAAIVWDSVVPQFAATESVTVAEFEKLEENASVALLKSSKQPAEALRLAHYMASPTKGGQVFAKNGYRNANATGGNPKP